MLKVDIDSVEGSLLHEATRMLSAGQTAIQSILIELGDPKSAWAHCYQDWCNASRPMTNPRGGDVSDLYVLQRQLGFDIYRVNIHVNREILTWRGENANARMSPPQPHWEQLHSVRSMRKLELLRRDTPREAFPTLLRASQSLLITKERLLTVG